MSSPRLIGIATPSWRSTYALAVSDCDGLRHRSGGAIDRVAHGIARHARDDRAGEIAVVPFDIPHQTSMTS